MSIPNMSRRIAKQIEAQREEHRTGTPLTAPEAQHLREAHGFPEDRTSLQIIEQFGGVCGACAFHLARRDSEGS